MNTLDQLDSVRANLFRDTGKLRLVSEETGIPYDTILRIKNGESDPGYSKVKALADYYASKVIADPSVKAA